MAFDGGGGGGRRRLRSRSRCRGSDLLHPSVGTSSICSFVSSLHSLLQTGADAKRDFVKSWLTANGRQPASKSQRWRFLIQPSLVNTSPASFP